jgi:tight adherence protein B
MLSVLLGFVGLWRLVTLEDPVETRLAEYGATGYAALPEDYESGPRQRLPLTNRLLAGFGLGPRLAEMLTQADMPVTAAEFTLMVLGIVLLAFLMGVWRGGLLLGLVLGLTAGLLPAAYLRWRVSRRQRAFMEQIPEILTLIVGSLRAGYGLQQSIEVLVTQMSPPASKEFARVTRAITLGVPIQRALGDMAQRLGSTDWDMVVTAINVQYETGGNLAQTLEIIGTTVRERIRILREIRVLTAQQRLTGYLLAVIPVVLGILIFFINPEYMMQMFQPGWLWLPVLALLLQVLGFLVIRRIVDIEV